MMDCRSFPGTAEAEGATHPNAQGPWGRARWLSVPGLQGLSPARLRSTRPCQAGPEAPGQPHESTGMQRGKKRTSAQRGLWCHLERQTPCLSCWGPWGESYRTKVSLTRSGRGWWEGPGEGVGTWCGGISPTCPLAAHIIVLEGCLKKRN